MSGVKHTPVAPCPWCGGNAKCNELRRGNYRREGDNYQVVCNKCRARGPLVQDSQAEAVSAWNSRLVEPDLLETLRAADEALAQVTAFEDDARYIMGNTNFAIVQQRREQIRAALARARGEQSPNHSDQKEVGNG